MPRPDLPASKHLITAVLFPLILFGFFCTALPAQEITIAASEYAPYNYSEGGRIKGVSSDVVTKVLEKAGVCTPIKLYPWPRAYRMALETPNTLIFPIARTAQRETLFKWVAPISPADTYLFKLRTRTDIVIETLADTRGYRIGCVREDFTLDYLAENAIPIQIVNHKEDLNIRMLVNGRLDLIPFTELAFVRRLKELNLPLDRFEKAYHLEAISRDFYLAFSKETPDELVETIAAALEAVKAEGTYQQILKRYLK